METEMLEAGTATESVGGGVGLDATCLDEIELVALAKTNTRWFGNLYDRYYNRILNYTYRRTGDVGKAEEITSNTFFKALRSLPAYDNRGKFGAWLYRIAENEIRLYWRVRQRSRESPPCMRTYDRVQFISNDDLAVEEAEELEFRFGQLQAALRQLPERYQTVLVLRYLEGLSYEDVGDVIGKKLGTVKSLIHRGLQKLRKHFDSIDQDRTSSQHGPLQGE